MRPKLIAATIVLSNAETHFGFGPKEADRLWTDFDAGLIKGNTVFPARALFSHEDEDGNQLTQEKTIFINMINVGAVVFHEEE